MLKISIVVPSFNQAPYLARTLDSILEQSIAPFEVIVCDGASTDGSVDILRDYAKRYPSLRWISEPDKGPADAVNKGLAKVTGDVIGIQSSDDIYYPDVFKVVTEYFRDHAGCGFVYGDVDGIDERDNVEYQRQIPEFSWEAFFGISLAIPQSSIFFRRELVDSVGGWNPRYYSCDIDYWMRLLFRTKAVHIPMPLSGWRRYPDQRTQPKHARKIWDDYWRMIDESKELQAAPRRVQRLAQASKHILAMRYPPSPSRAVVLWHLSLGFLMHPGFWRYNPPAMIAAPLPGYKAMRWVYRKLRGRQQQSSLRKQED